MKPGNFLLTAHVTPFGLPSGASATGFQLIAPWESDPRKWLRLPWVDRYSTRSYRVTTRGETGARALPASAPTADVLDEGATHPESKSAAPDGSVCGRLTVGELRRRTIEVGRIAYVAKESNRLEDVHAGLLHDEPKFLNVYDDPRRDPWVTEVLPRLRTVPTSKVAKEFSRSRSTVKRWKSGQPDLASR